MPAPSRFATTHPWAVVSVWLVVVALLGVAGLGVEDRLSAGGLEVSNSESARARALIGGNFGDSATVPVLLRGPRADVKRQGRKLVTALSKRPGVRVLSPWSASSGQSALRPSSSKALLLLTISGSRADIARRSEAARRLVDRRTVDPVRATVTGLPLLSSEGTRSSLSAIHRAELIALPLLFIALLLVFQSFVAAAIPAAFGAATIAASTGALSLLAGAIHLDAFALAISCMVGLALAVDYSLLMVSRMREELAEQHDGDVVAAAGRAAAPTMRTVAVAAAAIVVAMAVAAAVAPGTGLVATAVGVTVVALLAASTAILVVPAMLALAADHLGQGSALGAGGGLSAGLARLAARRPELGLVAAGVLLLAAIPVLGLKTGAPTAKSLPPGNAARAEYDTVAKSMGAGWTEPFEIVAVTHKGAVTTAPRLAALARVQRALAKDPGVRAVLGPGSIAGSAAKLRRSGRRALAASKGIPRRDGGRLRRLDAGVSSAADGFGSLRNSLSTATSAATRIAAGSQSLEGGVGKLKSGINGAGSGARSLASKLADAGRGADGLAAQSAAAGNGARGVRDGARTLSSGLARIATAARDLEIRLNARGTTLTNAQSLVRKQTRDADDILAAAERSIVPTTTSALRARNAIAKARRALTTDVGAALDEPIRLLGSDAGYASRIAGATPTREAETLATAVAKLADGAESITRRVRALSGSVGALTDGSSSLATSLAELDSGAAAISNAAGSVRSGATGLADGVASGEQRSGRLASGLDDARSAVKGLGGGSAGAGAATSRKASASFFDSGYFLLAALESGEGGNPIGVNVDHGGQGARIVVVPRYVASDPRTQALYERLQVASAELGRTLGADSAVGGPAATLADYDEIASSRLPIIVIVLTIATALLLGILLRSIVVPIVGVALNLLAVGATLGILALLFQGDSPLLGGPGVIDAIAVTAIFGVVFALSMDYQVFILSRVREEWLRTGDEERALEVGMSRTARVVTGAALSMLGVFVAFAFADVASLRQFGVGLAIAIVIDATLVRLVLLPAALRFAGDYAWYVPGFEDAEPAPERHVHAVFETPAIETGSTRC